MTAPHRDPYGSGHHDNLGDAMRRSWLAAALALVAGIWGCECLPENVPCDAPSVGSGLDEERCVPGGTYTIGADAIPIEPLYRLPDGGRCTAQEVGQDGCVSSNDPGPRNDWAPKHQAWLSPFYLDTYEVTNGRYNECVTAGACTQCGGPDPRCGVDPAAVDWPVFLVTWQQAYDYCLWRGKRLPTESEWEAAARGKNALDYPWGNQLPDPPPRAIPRRDQNVGTDTNDVSPFGIHDLSGSAFEWVGDWYAGPYSQSAGVLKNPTGPTEPQQGFVSCCAADRWRWRFGWNAARSVRGVQWAEIGGYELNHPVHRYPVWTRYFEQPAVGDPATGFRCARPGQASGSNTSGLESYPLHRNLQWKSY